ncbi:MAG: glycosyltransferase family 4 protein [bacterium]
MKIAVFSRLIYPFYIGGMNKSAFFLSKHLSKLGDEICLITRKRPVGYNGKSDFEFSLKEFDWPKIKPSLLAYLKFSQNAWNWIKDNSFDAVYWNGTCPPFIEKNNKISFITAVHGMESFKEKKMLKRLYYSPFNMLFSYYLRRSQKIITNGSKLIEEASRYFNYPKKDLITIPNGIDPEYIDNIRLTKGDFQQKKQISLLTVCRLTENKGINVLVEAFKKIENMFDVELIIVGNGPQEAKLKDLSAKRNIRFLGEVSDSELHYIYRKVDCFICPTLYEGMPTVILEAMYAELPIISSDIGAIDTMVGSDNGILVKAGDRQILADAIKIILSKTRENRLSMGVNSRKKVIDRFTFSVIAKQTRDVLTRLKENKG